MYEKREKIRVLLARNCLSYVWLVNQLNKLGFDIVPNELCQFVTGRRRGVKCDQALDACIRVLERYERLYVEDNG